MEFHTLLGIPLGEMPLNVHMDPSFAHPGITWRAMTYGHKAPPMPAIADVTSPLLKLFVRQRSLTIQNDIVKYLHSIPVGGAVLFAGASKNLVPRVFFLCSRPKLHQFLGSFTGPFHMEWVRTPEGFFFPSMTSNSILTQMNLVYNIRWSHRIDLVRQGDFDVAMLLMKYNDAFHNIKARMPQTTIDKILAYLRNAERRAGMKRPKANTPRSPGPAQKHLRKSNNNLRLSNLSVPSLPLNLNNPPLSNGFLKELFKNHSLSPPPPHSAQRSPSRGRVSPSISPSKRALSPTVPLSPVRQTVSMGGSTMSSMRTAGNASRVSGPRRRTGSPSLPPTEIFSAWNNNNVKNNATSRRR
jgi:hypothetical protein